MVTWNEDMSQGKAAAELQVLEDKFCFDLLEREKIKGMFGWVELTDEQILFTQKICNLYLEFASKLLEVVPFSPNRDEALKALVRSQHHSLDAITGIDQA